MSRREEIGRPREVEEETERNTGRMRKKSDNGEAWRK